MGKRVFLKRVEGLCPDCFFDNRKDCLSDKHGCKFRYIYKQLFFERVGEYCNECYFNLEDEPYCSFPKDKKADCDDGVYKLKGEK